MNLDIKNTIKSPKIVIPLVVLLLLIISVSIYSGYKSYKYNQALTYIKQGNWNMAKSVLSDIKNYDKSQSLIVLTDTMISFEQQKDKNNKSGFYNNTEGIISKTLNECDNEIKPVLTNLKNKISKQKEVLLQKEKIEAEAVIQKKKRAVEAQIESSIKSKVYDYSNLDETDVKIIKDDINMDSMYKYSIANSIYNRKVGETETALGNLNQAKEQLDSISPSYNGKYANDIESLKNKISNKMVAEEDKSARETEMLNNKDKEQKRQQGIQMGMTAEEVKSTWGKPEDINRTTTANGVQEQWVYGIGKYIYFEDGIVTAIQE